VARKSNNLSWEFLNNVNTPSVVSTEGVFLCHQLTSFFPTPSKQNVTNGIFNKKLSAPELLGGKL